MGGQTQRLQVRWPEQDPSQSIEPGKRGGKPCIRGMRITVYDVLEYLAAGMSYDEVLGEFPYLRREDILACLSFVADRERKALVVDG